MSVHIAVRNSHCLKVVLDCSMARLESTNAAIKFLYFIANFVNFN